MDKLNYGLFQNNFNDISESDYVELCNIISHIENINVSHLYTDKDLTYKFFLKIKMILSQVVDDIITHPIIKKEDIQNTSFSIGEFVVQQNKAVLLCSLDYLNYTEEIEIKQGEKYKILDSYRRQGSPYDYYVLMKDIEKIIIPALKTKSGTKFISGYENKSINAMRYFVYRISR